jgi:hypothetical protein
MFWVVPLAIVLALLSFGTLSKLLSSTLEVVTKAVLILAVAYLLHGNVTLPLNSYLNPYSSSSSASTHAHASSSTFNVNNINRHVQGADAVRGMAGSSHAWLCERQLWPSVLGREWPCSDATTPQSAAAEGVDDGPGARESVDAALRGHEEAPDGHARHHAAPLPRRK